MNAYKWAMYVFCFVIATGIINSTGIFEEQIISPDVNLPEADLGDGITELDSGISSTEDLSGLFDGGEMLLNILSTIKMIFVVLLVPGPFLLDLGVASSIALGVQALANITEIWGLMQLISGRSTKGMD